MSALMSLDQTLKPDVPRRLIWPPSHWPLADRLTWSQAHKGEGPDGSDNPAAGWSTRTLKKNQDGYGRYLSWLDDVGQLRDKETPAERITLDRVTAYVDYLKETLAPVSVGMTIGALNAAATAFAPGNDWKWLSKRYSRLKAKARPSREKRHAIQHTLDLYRFGKRIMDKVEDDKGRGVAAAQRYQTGLMVALLAARPLRIRNFQDIRIGTSLRWDGQRYWLTFSSVETKTGKPIDEPCPSDLMPYLENFLRVHRPVLLKQASKRGADCTHQRLWTDRYGMPLKEAALRDQIKCYTEAEFGTAVWPHLFRDCLLTSIAIDHPDLMAIGAALLSHASSKTGEKHYNQARMIDASRNYAMAILDLREEFLDELRRQQDGGG